MVKPPENHKFNSLPKIGQVCYVEQETETGEEHMVQRQNRLNRKDQRNWEIILRVAQGELYQQIAQSYGISPGRVQQIIQKERKWLERGFYCLQD